MPAVLQVPNGPAQAVPEASCATQPLLRLILKSGGNLTQPTLMIILIRHEFNTFRLGHLASFSETPFIFLARINV